MKPYGTSLAFGIHWILVLAVTYWQKHIFSKIKIVCIIWIVICMLGTIFMWLVVPETKDKSLAEIQSKLAKGGTSARQREMGIGV